MTNQAHQLSVMIAIVAEKFEGKLDKGGKPYVLHCMAVMHMVESDDLEIKQMAAGHDLFEDTDVTKQYLRDRGFTERVIDGIMGGTKIPGESYEEYKFKVMSNPDTRKWKKADLRHNSDIRRLKGLRQKDFERLAKYAVFFAEIEAAEQEEKSACAAS